MGTKGGVIAVVGACSLVGCAPSSTSVRIAETLGTPQLVTGPPTERTIQVSASAGADGLEVRLTESRRCERSESRTARRRELRTKDVNDFVIALEYIVAVGLLAGGTT